LAKSLVEKLDASAEDVALLAYPLATIGPMALRLGQEPGGKA